MLSADSPSRFTLHPRLVEQLVCFLSLWFVFSTRSYKRIIKYTAGWGLELRWQSVCLACMKPQVQSPFLGGGGRKKKPRSLRVYSAAQQDQSLGYMRLFFNFNFIFFLGIQPFVFVSFPYCKLLFCNAVLLKALYPDAQTHFSLFSPSFGCFSAYVISDKNHSTFIFLWQFTIILLNDFSFLKVKKSGDLFYL